MMDSSFLYLSRAEVALCLPMDRAIEKMRVAFQRLSTGQIEVPLRAHLKAPKGDLLVMPSLDSAAGVAAVKMVTVFAENRALGLPLIQGQLMLIDALNGQPLAQMDAALITAIRTGAASGLATDLLAPVHAHTAAIFGCGIQAETQLAAISTVRKLTRVLVFGRSSANLEDFCQRMSHSLGLDVRPAQGPEELAQAQIVCTATTSSTPVFQAAHLASAVHINAVGAYHPRSREIPSDTVCAACLIVDQRGPALDEAGDILIPISEGRIGADHIQAELGELCGQAREKNPLPISLFKSVGNGAQDLYAALAVWEEACKTGLGTQLPL